MEEIVQLSPSLSVSKSIADWIRLMPWDGIMYSLEIARTGIRELYTNKKKYIKNILGIYWDMAQGVYQTKDIKSLILTTNLEEIVLGDEKFLPSYLIGSKIKNRSDYIIHRN